MVTQATHITGLEKHKNYALSWSAIKQIEACPQQFLWSRGWPGIDLGNGMGKAKTKPKESSEHSQFMGDVIQGVLEVFYNESLWKDPSTLTSKLDALIDTMYDKYLSRHKIDWAESPSQFEMLTVIRDGVFGFLQTFKAHKLVGPYAKSEVGLYPMLRDIPLGGRLDFVLVLPDKSILILDGKNGKRYKDKKTGELTKTFDDPDQLRWYALLYYLVYGVYPTKLGFIRFRFPYGWRPPESEWPLDVFGRPTPPEPETGIEWVSFTEADMVRLIQKAEITYAKLMARQFDPTPSSETCKRCDFESVCEVRIAMKKAWHDKRSPSTKLVSPKGPPVTISKEMEF